MLRRVAFFSLAAVGACVLGPASAARGQATNGGGPLVLEIWKGRRYMELREGQEPVRRFRIVLGSSPREPKRVQGDGRTPVGRYFISEKKAQSRFHRFLGLNYPNIDDAERGYWERQIDARQWADIFLANLRMDMPPASTRLGGRVGIHGFGGRPLLPIDWTQGCIAVSDPEIEYLFRRVPIGTPVFIHE
jgi:murein L,D-transpeptidase YafK